MTEQIIWVFVWSNHYPEYNERMHNMSHPNNIHNAFEAAGMMFLVPKE